MKEVEKSKKNRKMNPAKIKKKDGGKNEGRKKQKRKNKGKDEITNEAWKEEDDRKKNNCEEKERNETIECGNAKKEIKKIWRNKEGKHKEKSSLSWNKRNRNKERIKNV